MVTQPGVRKPDDALEGLIADVISAVQGLEYGAVTVLVKGGRIVGLERSEKRRLAEPLSPTQKPYIP